MRCLNCGWNNSSDSLVCIKCGHTLGNNYGDNIPRQSVSDFAKSVPNSKPTAVYAVGEIPKSRVTSIQQIAKCPNCSYPVAGNFESCPNCGTPLKKADRVAAVEKQKQPQPDMSLVGEKMTCQECGHEVLMSSTYCPNCGQRLHKPTIRRQIRHTIEAEQEIKPKCSLEMIPEEGEYADTEKKEFEGMSIILNRENTDRSNRSITSKEQAELSFEDGHWYLVDKSELQTTYLQATRKIELQPDDIIVLGDRRFKFSY